MIRSNLLFIVLFFVAAVAAAGSSTAGANPDGGQEMTAIAETPDLMMEETITSFDIVPFRVAWLNGGRCPDDVPETADAPTHRVDRVTAGRVPTYGGPVRLLFERHIPHDSGECNDYRVYSNVVADGTYLYWVDGSGLVRLPHLANLGDEPQLVSAAVKSAGGREVLLAAGDDAVYTASYGQNGQAALRKVFTETGISTFITGGMPAVKKLAFDGKYLYWISNGNLWRANQTQGVDFAVDKIAEQVTAYYAAGAGPCVVNCQDYVYIADNQHRVVRYRNKTGTTSAPIYASDDPDSVSRIYDLTADADHLFIREAREPVCTNPGSCLFTAFTDVLLRAKASPGGTAEPIDLAEGIVLPEDDTTVNGRVTSTIGLYGGYIYYQREGKIYRLPQNAAALPQVDLTIQDMLITQGIQSWDHDVVLVAGKRTFVRVFGRADGAIVPGVTAVLSRYDAQSGEPIPPFLQPVNQAGTHLNVFPAPLSDDVEAVFLYELPISWVQGGPLRLRAFINPDNVPLERAADRANNEFRVDDPPPTLATSPRLEIDFHLISYGSSGGVLRTVDPTYNVRVRSYLRRLYPLATAPGGGAVPSPGLRVNIVPVKLAGLDSRVQQTHPSCVLSNDPGTCAPDFVNNYLKSMRYVLQADSFYFGTFDNAGVGTKGVGLIGNWVASAPHTTARLAAHEIAHGLGRRHPEPGGKLIALEQCGHSPSDPNYPYADSKAGLVGWQGFDWGDPAFSQPRSAFSLSDRFDVMSYCNPKWISDYTYEALYQAILIPLATAAPVESPQRVQEAAAQQLMVQGVIYPTAAAAELHFVQVPQQVLTAPPLVAGEYAVRFLDAAGDPLTSRRFAPDETADGEDAVTFGFVVPLPAAATRFEIIAVGDEKVLAARAISSQAPQVSGVRVPGAAGELSGQVTLEWIGSDADGGDLTYDIFYSRDGGTSYVPLEIGVDGEAATIDTSALAGGKKVRFRVIANDGVRTGSAESPFYTITPKPPVPLITDPGDGHRAQWGQLVQFFGEAYDLQDGFVDAADLIWTANGEPLGSGYSVASSELPVGVNEIELTARNSQGIAAGTTITVIIGDDLAYPGPTLSVGPNSIGWHVYDGETEPQEATLTVSNLGSGSFTWSASDNARWLNVRGRQGLPSLLAVTADPTQIPEDSTAEATITVTADLPDGSRQVVAIPVTLSSGYVWLERGAGATQPLFLPLVAGAAR